MTTRKSTGGDKSILPFLTKGESEGIRPMVGGCKAQVGIVEE
jgi:hypothetical protein